jgi:hypothetical protein
MLPIAGSIILFTAVTFVAGKPLISACLPNDCLILGKTDAEVFIVGDIALNPLNVGRHPSGIVAEAASAFNPPFQGRSLGTPHAGPFVIVKAEEHRWQVRIANPIRLQMT